MFPYDGIFSTQTPPLNFPKPLADLPNLEMFHGKNWKTQVAWNGENMDHFEETNYYWKMCFSIVMLVSEGYFYIIYCI